MTTNLRERSNLFTDIIIRDTPQIQPDHQARRQILVRKTCGCRRLSIIIPTYNEEKTIGDTLDRVLAGNVWEVIVVDGQSTDRTRAIARTRGVTVVESSPCRGRQLTKGASIATGDTLLFLHADTILPERYDEYVFRALAKPIVSAGAFRLLIDADGRLFRVIENMVNLRSHIRQMPYGDQAIFMSTNTFHDVGGFPDIPVMEDYAMILRLRRMGRIEIAPAPVITSARRWIKHGVWRTTLRNQICIAAFWMGLSPSSIAQWLIPSPKITR